jgi:hypothetical protein
VQPFDGVAFVLFVDTNSYAVFVRRIVRHQCCLQKVGKKLPKKFTIKSRTQFHCSTIFVFGEAGANGRNVCATPRRLVATSARAGVVDQSLDV